jgi:hypothetical protein
VGKKVDGKSRGLYFFSVEKKLKSSMGERIFVHHRKVSAVNN